MIKHIGLPLRVRPILLITSMITDRIGLHSVLLPLLVIISVIIIIIIIVVVQLLLLLLVLRPSISSLFESATAYFITKCDGPLLQSATAFLIQSAISVISKWNRYDKVRKALQSATIITKCATEQC